MSDFESLAAAIAAVRDGGTVNMSSDMTVDDKTIISKDVTIKANGATFNKQVEIESGDVVIDGANLVCSAATIAIKNNAPAVAVTGDGDFTLKNSNISGTSRTGVSVGTSGEVVISGNKFNAGSKKIYNAIEFSIGDTSADITKAVISDNEFTGTLGNNAVSLYNLAEGADISMTGNKFTNISVDNNCIRLSNPRNVSAAFTLKDNEYLFSGSEPSADGYTAFMLLQDYSKKDTPRQEFNKFSIHFDNLKRSGKKLSENGSGLDKVYYVYSDQNGILEDGVNDPIVDFK